MTNILKPILRPILRQHLRSVFDGVGGGGAAPVFDPTMLPSLYAWFDPMDQGTKFQDEAGTIPVTAAGQPVLHLSDKSGNGRNATATSSANSPVDGAFASQPGAPAALDYNGTSSALVAHSIASLFNGASPQWTITVAVEHLNGVLFGAGYSGNTTTNEYLSASRGTGRFSLATRHAGASLTIADAGPSGSLPDVITIRRNGASFDSWVNGVKEVTAGVAAPEASELFDRFAIGANHRTTLAAYFSGNIGEMIVSAIADSDTDVAKTQAYVMHRLSTAAIVDLFIVTGQSNARGQGTAGGTVDTGWGYQVSDSGGMTKLVDPVEGAAFGSAWPAFARRWKDATGRASAWRNKAVSGSGLIKDNGTGHWGVTGALRAQATSSAAASYSALSGNWRYTLGNVYVCWQQGETDAGSYGDVFEGATVNAANYKAAQIELFDHFFANIPSLDAIFVSELGEYVPTVAEFALIRQAQNEAVADTQNVHLVFNGAKDFPASGMMKADGHHYSQPGYDAMGEGMAAGAAAIVYP